MALSKESETAIVSTKGQVVIPDRIRRQYHIEKSTRIHFISQDNNILMCPINSEYIANGLGLLRTKGKLGKMLLQEREKERKKEERKITEFLRKKRGKR